MANISGSSSAPTYKLMVTGLEAAEKLLNSVTTTPHRLRLLMQQHERYGTGYSDRAWRRPRSKTIDLDRVVSDVLFLTCGSGSGTVYMWAKMAGQLTSDGVVLDKAEQHTCRRRCSLHVRIKAAGLRRNPI